MEEAFNLPDKCQRAPTHTPARLDYLSGWNFSSDIILDDLLYYRCACCWLLPWLVVFVRRPCPDCVRVWCRLYMVVLPAVLPQKRERGATIPSHTHVWASVGIDRWAPLGIHVGCCVGQPWGMVPMGTTKKSQTLTSARSYCCETYTCSVYVPLLPYHTYNEYMMLLYPPAALLGRRPRRNGTKPTATPMGLSTFSIALLFCVCAGVDCCLGIFHPSAACRKHHYSSTTTVHVHPRLLLNSNQAQR